MAQDPRERNRALLNTVFGFRNEAPLKKFIQDRTNRREEHFTLKEILESLKEAISAGRWFDNNNPSIIICPPELEAVIDQKALHVLQVKDLVLSQLIPMDSQKNKENQEDKTNPISTTTTLIAKTETTRPTPTYELKPALTNVFQTLEEFDRTQRKFAYQEITTLLSTYIIKNKNRLFDQRNIHVALVEDDPLGTAFGVKAFHRNQVHTLLMTQLTITTGPETNQDHKTPPITNANTSSQKDNCDNNQESVSKQDIINNTEKLQNLNVQDEG